MYRNLRAEMARQGVTVGDIAEALGVRKATASDKLNGRYRFYFDETMKIKNRFFSDHSLEYLFKRDDEKKNSA